MKATPDAHAAGKLLTGGAYTPYTMADVRSVAPRFNAISFFAGGGGASSGLMLAGGSMRTAVEFSPLQAQVYRRNNPHCQLEQMDVREFTANESAARRLLRRAGLVQGELDYLDSSPPCQPHSQAGKGIGDPSRETLHSGVKQRYAATLPFSVADAVHLMLPKVSVMENVPGLVHRTPDFLDRLLNAFRFRNSRRVYYSTYKILSADDFGVPQKRQRVFVISIRRDVAEAVGIDSDELVHQVYPRPTVSHALSIRTALTGLQNHHHEELPFFRSIWRSKLPELLAELPACPDKPRRLKNVSKYFTLVRCSWDHPAPTLVIIGQKPNGLSGAIHPELDRKFTIPELMRLFGLPEDYGLIGTIPQAVDTICNMVPPFLAKAVADSVFDRVLRHCLKM